MMVYWTPSVLTDRLPTRVLSQTTCSLHSVLFSSSRGVGRSALLDLVHPLLFLRWSISVGRLRPDRLSCHWTQSEPRLCCCRHGRRFECTTARGGLGTCQAVAQDRGPRGRGADCTELFLQPTQS
ncbi:unnamed protein product [Protopolystoma xenopodis]|uniref:Uncharacterized protein n=1 Tax=Protopolystoma xenopodis TaxID=117903 RepID=A0A448X7V4_9PLAT|nr:unnamed protein product [Protopolystoma xenopodis]